MRKGFLPIVTNTFDRVFISVVVFVAVHLLWMRVAEPAGLSINIATVISLILAVLVLWKG